MLPLTFAVRLYIFFTSSIQPGNKLPAGRLEPDPQGRPPRVGVPVRIDRKETLCPAQSGLWSPPWQPSWPSESRHVAAAATTARPAVAMEKVALRVRSASTVRARSAH